MDQRYDVTILGYGPVGAVLANLLGRDGLSVAVVDRMHGIYDKPRAINIDHEVMRLLQSVGLADAVEQITRHHTGTEFRGLGDRLIKAFKPMQPPYPLGWAPNLMFTQPEFEPLLRDGVARYPTVDVMLGTEALALEQDEEEVRLLVSSQTQERRTIRSRTLVACDGAASPTRRRLGITQDSLDFDEWWTVVDAWVGENTNVPARTTQFCRPSGPTTYVVGPRNLRRWELKLLPHEDPASYEDRDVVRRRLAPFVDPDTIDIWRFATYRFHALVAHDWRRGRVLLAGDAAHQMPPFMAQGLCSGIRDAANLAWKLTSVLRDGAPETLLDSYQQERKPHLRQLVETTKQLGLIIGELDPVSAAARDERLGQEMDGGASVTVRQRLVPDLTAGLIAMDATGTPVAPAGQLSPQPHVLAPDGRTVLLDELVGPRFLLLTRGDAPQDWVDAAAAAAWEQLEGVRLVLAEPGTQPSAFSVVETQTLLADWMVTHDCRTLLVRPDKYVYGCAKDAVGLNRQIMAIHGFMSAPSAVLQ